MEDIRDLAMGNWEDYIFSIRSDSEFDIIIIECPEWIKMMDDVLTERDYECDIVIPITNDRGQWVRLQYLREKNTTDLVGERESEINPAGFQYGEVLSPQ
jgi:hypothetical protein